MRANSLKRLSSVVLASAAFGLSAAHAASSPTGVWIDHTGRGGVEIKDCGDGKLCGHVVWLKDETDAKGCGLQILGNVKPIGGGQWDNGWIYSPEKKQRFSVELTPLDDNRLRVKGYKGIKLISRTMIWHRASDTLERCDKEKAAAPKVTPQRNDQDRSATASERAVQAKAPPRAPVVINAPREEAAEERAAPKRAKTAKAIPAPRQHETYEAVPDAPRTVPTDRDDDIYAAPPRRGQDDRHADRRDDDDRDDGGRSIEGLASLLENFTKGDGIEVGDGYGMKVKRGPNGEKNCHLNVPFVTVEFPCED